MTHVDEPRLESDLGYRFEYTAGFIGFGSDDIAAIHGAAEHLALNSSSVTPQCAATAATQVEPQVYCSFCRKGGSPLT